MKLLNCLECKDIVSLATVALKIGATRTCLCGKSKGGYIDERRVKVEGPCRVLGIDSRQYAFSVDHGEELGQFYNFEWFVISLNSPTVVKLDRIKPAPWDGKPDYDQRKLVD